MSKKIDLSKLLTKGSAKQRAALLIYHYTILEAIDIGQNKELKPILTEQEAKAIFDSFKDNREAKIYNEYRSLNRDFITTIKHLYYTGLQFERDYYKYLYEREILKKVEDKSKKNRANLLGENLLINSYSRFINFFTALKVYAKEKGYTNRYILDNIDTYLEGMQELYNHYPIEIEEGVELSQSFEEVEPDYKEVQDILMREFNYKYEYEKEPE
jgi:hypothetical protein